MSRRTKSLLPAVIAVAVLGLSGCGGSSSSEASDSQAGDSQAGDSQAGETTPVELTVGDAAATGRCMVPTAETLSAQDVAFEGTVTSLADGRAEFDVERWFTVDQGDTAVVASPSEQLQDLLLAVRFEDGATYLVSATDGQVSLCGFTAEKTPELEGLYEDAFAEQ